MLVVSACGRFGFDNPTSNGGDASSALGDGDTDGLALVDSSPAASDGALFDSSAVSGDAPPPPPNETCNTAMLLSIGSGWTTGSTCGATDDDDVFCIATGTPEVFYEVVVPADGAMYQLEVNPATKFKIAVSQPLSNNCTFNRCGPNLDIQNTGSSALTVPFIVEENNGACGDFMVRIQ